MSLTQTGPPSESFQSSSALNFVLQMELQGRAMDYFFKLLIEISQVVKSALVADLTHAHVAFYQTLTSIANAYFVYKMGEVFLGSVLEISAEA